MSNIQISRETLESISNIISELLTHTEITNLFTQFKYSYIEPLGSNKFIRVYNSFAKEYNLRKNEAVIFNVIFSIINPVKFSSQETYDDLLYKFNTVLAHEGLKLSYRLIDDNFFYPQETR